MKAPKIIQLDSELDVVLCIQLVRDEAILQRFPNIDIEQFVLAVSEIANNALRHGRGGIFEFSILNKGGILKVVISDTGPGISNLNLAKSDGYSTIQNSLGIGLMVAQRSVDYINIETEVNKGTIVTLEKHRPLNSDFVDYGLVSIADPNYHFNGDQFVLKEYRGDSVLIGLIDGPGQGYDAYAVANACKNYIRENYINPIDEILINLDAMLHDSNDQVGITASLMRIEPGKMIYKGYGDTHSYLVQDGVYHAMTNEGGRLGQIKKYRSGVSKFNFTDKLNVILCTDGISVLPMHQARKGTAQIVANSLFDDFHKPHGDASILSLKYKMS